MSAEPSAGWLEGREHVLPVRIYYEDTDFTGVVIITAGAGRVMRTFIATTIGYRNDDLTPEDLAANWDTVMNSSEFVVPDNAMEEQQLLYGTTLTVQ